MSLAAVAAVLAAATVRPVHGQVGTTPHYLDFDGANDYLSVPDTDTLSVGSGSADGSLTIETWFRPDSMSAKQNMVGKWGSGANLEYRLYIASGAIRLDLYDGSAQATVSAYTTANQSALVGAWHHLAATYDGRGGAAAAGGISLYIDGVAVAVTRVNSAAYVAMENGNATLQIGRESASFRQYDGALDEVRLWNVARTQAEIQAQMTTELTGAASGLVGYWRLNEGTGTTAGDGSALGNTATLFNGPTWTAGGPMGPSDPDVTPPEISNVAATNITDTGAVISFTTDEATTGWVSITPNASCPCTDVYSATVGTTHTITLSGLTPDTLYNYQVKASDQAANLATGPSLTFRTLVPAPDTTPPAVSLTRPLAGPVSGIVVVEATATDNVGVAGVQFRVDGALLGAEDTVPPYSTSWDTHMALDGPHTIAAEARDAAGNVSTASVGVNVNNSAAPEAPFYLDFDGTNDYLSVADANDLSFGNAAADTAMTIETWFRPDSMSAKQNLVGKWGSGANQEYRLFIASGSIRIDLYDGSAQATTSAFTATSQNALLGAWHHLAVTYDGRGGSTAAAGIGMYVDGVAVQLTRVNSAAYVAMENGTAPLQIARESTNFRQLDGSLDDLRIWNVARTPVQIQTQMSVELTGTEPGLVAYWKFNEGSGTVANDASSFGHTATLFNGPAWMSGGPLVPASTDPAAITSAASAAFQVGLAGSFTVTATGDPVPAITSAGALPPGVTVVDNGNGTATIAGTPAAGSAGAYPLTITANNGVGAPANQAFTLSVSQAPAISSAASAAFPLASPGSFTVTATGFPVPALSMSGTLPSGVSFASNGNGTATLAGTPAPGSGGVYPLVFTASNGVGAPAAQNFTLTVQGCTLSPAAGAITPATIGASYSFAFTGVGGTDFSFAVTGGALPAGLALTSAGTLAGSASVTGTFGFTVTGTNSTGCAASGAYSLTVGPDAHDESFGTAVGNTQFSVGAGAPATPAVVITGNVLSNDVGPGPLQAGPASIATTLGGNVAMSAAGTFVYTPPAGFAGPSDTFTYTLTDGNGATDTAAVTILVNGIVWYVDGAAGAGDGRSHNPFNSMAAASAAAQATQAIYVHQGSPAGATTLKAGQTLSGAGAVFALNSLLIPATTAPTLQGTVTLANDVTVSALAVNGGSGAAIAGTGLTGTETLNNVSIVGGSTGLNLANVGGTVTMTGGTITGVTAGADVLVSGGAGVLAIGASIVNTGGRSADIQNRSGGTVIFSAPIGDTGGGILLNANTGTTLAFTGGLALSTGANPGFTATGGGTLTITQEGAVVNTIATNGGTALTVANTEIGAAGLTFRSISAGGASFTAGAGIILDNTGTAAGNGSLTVTGNGAPQSGGIIRRKSGADGSTTSGIGIYLNATKNPSFNWMDLNRFDNSAIVGRSVSGFTLTNSVVNTAGTTAGVFEGPIVFGLPDGVDGLQGAGIIRNTQITGGVEDNVAFYGHSGSMSLVIESTTASSADCMIGSNSTTTGGRGLVLQMDGTVTASVTLSRCRVRNNRTVGLSASGADDATLAVVVTGSATDDQLKSQFSRASSGGQGQDGIIVTNAGNADVNARIENTTITGFPGTGVWVGQAAGNASALSMLQATIASNWIETPSAPTGGGIVARFSSTAGQVSQARLVIANNATPISAGINQYGLLPAVVISTPDAGTAPAVDVTMTGNHVDMRESAPGAGRGPIGVSMQSANGDLCANVSSNISHWYPTGNPQGGGIRLEQSGGAILRLEAGSQPLGTPAATVLSANNPAPGGTTMITEALGAVDVVANGSCQLPSAP